MLMVVSYLGGKGVELEVTRLMPGVGEYDCLECGGTGIFVGHPEILELPCVDCKATGRMLVSI